MKNNSTILIMSWWCNLGNGDMENQPKYLSIDTWTINFHHLNFIVIFRVRGCVYCTIVNIDCQWRTNLAITKDFSRNEVVWKLYLTVHLLVSERQCMCTHTSITASYTQRLSQRFSCNDQRVANVSQYYISKNHHEPSSNTLVPSAVN